MKFKLKKGLKPKDFLWFFSVPIFFVGIEFTACLATLLFDNDHPNPPKRKEINK
jgi:hypothetical protein